MNRKLLQEALVVLERMEFRTEQVTHSYEECLICGANNMRDDSKLPVHLANCEMDSVIKELKKELAT